MASGPLVGAAAVSLALVLAGCSHRAPGACSVTCGTSQICPEGLTCSADGFCHGAEDPADCTGWADAAPGVDAEPQDDDSDPCSGVTDSLSDSDSADVAIPDGDTVGIDRTITFDATCVTVGTVQIRVEISHPYRGDIELRLTSPAGDTDVLLKSSDDATPDISATFDSVIAEGDSADGDWVLNVRDIFQTDAGTLEYWSIGINRDAP